MTKGIFLSQGKVAIVDDDDYDYLNQYKWSYIYNGYAIRHTSTKGGKIGHIVRMHRVIINCPDNMEVDHINGNTLDNRKKNLRICTHPENLRNKKQNKNNTSGYKGVSWNKDKKKWQARIGVNGKAKSLGYYTDRLSASIVYDEAAKKFYGDFAHTNS